MFNTIFSLVTLLSFHFWITMSVVIYLAAQHHGKNTNPADELHFFTRPKHKYLDMKIDLKEDNPFAKPNLVQYNPVIPPCWEGSRKKLANRKSVNYPTVASTALRHPFVSVGIYSTVGDFLWRQLACDIFDASANWVGWTQLRFLFYGELINIGFVSESSLPLQKLRAWGRPSPL